MTSSLNPRTGTVALQAIARRQGEITSYAFMLLGGREQALAFLNHVDVDLGGRPIDLAIASDEGCAVVERALLRLASPEVSP